MSIKRLNKTNTPLRNEVSDISLQQVSYSDINEIKKERSTPVPTPTPTVENFKDIIIKKL